MRGLAFSAPWASANARPSQGRRRLLSGLAALVAAPARALPSPSPPRRPAPARPGLHPSDIVIEDVAVAFQEFRYRTPYVFGGRSVDRVTLLDVHCVVRTGAGRLARGFGSMPLGNAWSFPSAREPHERTLLAMKALAERLRLVTAGYGEPGHPVEIGAALEPAWVQAAAEVSRELGLAEPIPKLCALVTASPFDAALHDAYGKAHGRSCYETYGAGFLRPDLARWLGPEFRGQRLDRLLRARPRPFLFLYHSVGAGDPLTAADVRTPLRDGLPETLAEWIARDGPSHLKIKLNGGDLAADVARVAAIERAAAFAQARRGVRSWRYCLDFNERCPDVGYLLEFFRRVREAAPAALARVQYVEQPTSRDLRADRGNRMHEAARICPVVADEALTDLDSLALAQEMGYTGAALKACKGQTASLLMAAAARRRGMFLCVQDLTCPGASLVHSAGLAARVPGVATLEANARQYVPAANEGWDQRHPGLFDVREGRLRTAGLTGPGLGAVP